MRLKIEKRRPGSDTWEPDCIIENPNADQGFPLLVKELIDIGQEGVSIIYSKEPLWRTNLRYTLLPAPVKRKAIRETWNGEQRNDFNLNLLTLVDPVALAYFGGGIVRVVGDFIEYRDHHDAVHRYELVEEDDEVQP